MSGAQGGRTLLKVEDWAEIRRLHFAEGLGKQTIAKRLGVSRNTVKVALARSDPPRYRRARRASAVDAYQQRIRALLKDCPTMPATVIAERVGWHRGMTILKQRVRELRPLFLDPEPFQRTDYAPGELAQWDLWFPDVEIPVGYGHGARLPVIVGVTGYSRLTVARMIPSRAAPDLLLGHWAFRFTPHGRRPTGPHLRKTRPDLENPAHGRGHQAASLITVRLLVVRQRIRLRAKSLFASPVSR